jgi:hypothetical protein
MKLAEAERKRRSDWARIGASAATFVRIDLD